MKALDLLETAIATLEAVRNHYEEFYNDCSGPGFGPHPGDLITQSNQCLNLFRRVAKDIAVRAQKEGEKSSD